MEKRINTYTCFKSGHITVTKDVDEGTTPMIIDCPKCGMQAQSSWYDCDQDQDHTHEWYSPLRVEKIKDPGMREHVNAGGLMMRKKGEIGQYNQEKFSDKLYKSFRK